jgi:hypothetical protein
MSPLLLHPTGLHPKSLAAQVLDFMAEQRLGLRGLAAAADVVAADCRYNYWCGSEVKKSGHSEEGWMKLLEDGEQIVERATQAMQAYATRGNVGELCTAFTEVVNRLNDRSLPGS